MAKSPQPLTTNLCSSDNDLTKVWDAPTIPQNLDTSPPPPYNPTHSLLQIP